MKKSVLSAFAAVAAIGLAACDNTEAPEVVTAGGETETASEPVGTEPVATGEQGDSISISEDGVTADINDGDTSLSADIGDDPGVTVTND